MRARNDIDRAAPPRSVMAQPGAAAVAEPVLVSTSSAIREVLEKIDLVAHSPAPVFITGESGTGKEIVARLIHAKSPQSHRPSVAINCAALPKDVIDNELFGHEREAFTGAVSQRLGCFERAHGSTLFLDEITEMHAQVQAKLLRAIESKRFRRLGGYEDVVVDVRVVAATNRRISEALECGALRADLYYRLSVVEIALPPLRERKEDIPLLADHFLSLFCSKYQRPQKRFSDESLNLLSAFHWPGNVRELRNLVESLVLLCPSDLIESSYLPEKLCRLSTDPVPVRGADAITVPFGTSIADAERLLILHTLEKVGDNKSKAARILGMSRKALYDKLRLYFPEDPPGDA